MLVSKRNEIFSPPFIFKMHPAMLSFNWYNQAAHLKKILQELRSDDSFLDVTLVTDDKKSMRAHRNILSACSPVFQDILKLDEEAHLNTSFKHFYYFVNEYSLVDKREMMPLGPLIERIIRRDQERYGKRIVKL